MKNYKATINIDREIWDKFKAKCTERNTTASEEIRRFINLFVLEEETEEFDCYRYEDYPNTLKLAYDKIQGEILAYHDNRLDRIEARIDGLETDSKTETETKDSLDLRLAQINAQLQELIQIETETIRNQTNRSIAALADYLGIEEKRDEDLKYLGYGKKTDGKTETETEKVDGLETDGKTDILDGLSAELAERPQLTYSDREVFDLEPSIKSKTTIYRYRTGKSRPKDATFLDRWRVSPGGSDWMKVEKEVDFGGFNKETQ